MECHHLWFHDWWLSRNAKYVSAITRGGSEHKDVSLTSLVSPFIIGGPRAAFGSAVACGILLGVFEGVGVLLSRAMSEVNRPVLPPCELPISLLKFLHPWFPDISLGVPLCSTRGPTTSTRCRFLLDRIRGLSFCSPLARTLAFIPALPFILCLSHGTATPVPSNLMLCRRSTFNSGVILGNCGSALCTV